MLTENELAMILFRHCAMFDTSLDVRLYFKWNLILENDTWGQTIPSDDREWWHLMGEKNSWQKTITFDDMILDI